MNSNELFDLDAFMKRYEGLTTAELQTKRNRIVTQIWEYQNSHQVSDNPAVLLDFQNKKIEIALLEKLIFSQYDEEYFKCPDCGLLCSIEEKVCRQCHRRF